MPDPLAQISTRATPQGQQADPRQVPNSAGGWTFETGTAMRVRRFLTLGTDGGTYYAFEQALTRDNAKVIIAEAKRDAAALTREIVDISQAGRAPRNNPALFALAACAGLGDDAGRRAALDALPLVARTGAHLFLFAGYVEQFRGWGRGLRTAVAGWYTDKDASQAAYQVLKYRQRGGWTHRDLLRLSHPEAPDPAWRALFDFICRGETGPSRSHPNLPAAELPPLAEAFVRAQAATKTAQWVKLIADNPALSWEMLPDAALTEKAVWAALIDGGIPQTALMRQLPRLTNLGVIGPGSPYTEVVAAQLADRGRLARARVHPVNILVALKTYAYGRSVRGKSVWTPVSKITDALDAAFYAAFASVEPAGARTMLALDVSGSMTMPVADLPLSCRDASAALALVTVATEPHTFVTAFTSSGGYGFASGISTLDISPRQRLDDVIRKVSNLPWGGTDCALPMLWAAEQDIDVDHFAIWTDNETWAGQVHPHQALRAYREKTGLPARMSVMGMTSTGFTIADPADPGQLDVAGFDSAVPALLADFARGDI